MDRTERLYKMDRLLHDRGVVPVETFLAELEVSLATFKRDLEYLRDRLNAPVVWDRMAGGYRFAEQGVGERYALPGMWFSAEEIHALLSMQQLLSDLGPGLLTPHIAPLQARLRLLLEREGVPAEAVEQRIRLQHSQTRRRNPAQFPHIATAVLQRRRLILRHHHRGRDEVSEREVSPQRLNFYRENWYLDAWCHWRQALRSFALDAIESVQLSPQAALEVDATTVAATLDSGYGIFAGADIQWAELLFTPASAPWVSQEIWHPAQIGELQADGHYRLRLPYSQPTELVMDVLRHMPEVQVIAPASLQEAVRTSLEAGLARCLPPPASSPTS